jgi:hypothetical protein
MSCGPDPDKDTARHDGRQRTRAPLWRRTVGGGEAERQHHGCIGATEEGRGTEYPEGSQHHRQSREQADQHAAAGPGQEGSTIGHDEADGRQAPQQGFGGPAISPAWPGVSTKASGRPRPSVRAWILVVRPPRLMPGAWAFCPLCRRWHSDVPSRKCCRAAVRRVDHLRRPASGRDCPRYLCLPTARSGCTASCVDDSSLAHPPSARLSATRG